MKAEETEPIRVLLIDDDCKLLRSLSRDFTSYGFEIETSTCAAEARTLVSHYKFDALVCDQNMPGKSGLELLEELRITNPDLVMVMLSGQINGMEVAEKWAKEIGVTKIFAKPCNVSEIATHIQNSVNKQLDQC